MKKSLVACALAAVVLTGCDSSVDPIITYTTPSTITPVNDHSLISTETTVFVYRSGKVTSQDVETFEEDYYDVEELKNEFVNPAIESYNKTAGDGKVKLESAKVDSGKITLLMEYENTADYLGFNKKTNKYFANWTAFDVCDYEKISESGYALPEALLDENGNPVASSAIKSNVDLHLCVLDLGTGYPTGYKGEISFEGDIAYVSQGVTIDSMNSVTVADAPGLQYIIFK